MRVSCHIYCTEKPDDYGSLKWDNFISNALFPAEPMIGDVIGTQITQLNVRVKVWGRAMETNTKINLYVTEC